MGIMTKQAIFASVSAMMAPAWKNKLDIGAIMISRENERDCVDVKCTR